MTSFYCFSFWSLSRFHSRKWPALVTTTFPIPEVVVFENFDRSYYFIAPSVWCNTLELQLALVLNGTNIWYFLPGEKNSSLMTGERKSSISSVELKSFISNWQKQNKPWSNQKLKQNTKVKWIRHIQRFLFSRPVMVSVTSYLCYVLYWSEHSPSRTRPAPFKRLTRSFLKVAHGDLSSHPAEEVIYYINISSQKLATGNKVNSFSFPHPFKHHFLRKLWCWSLQRNSQHRAEW